MNKLSKKRVPLYVLIVDAMRTEVRRLPEGAPIATEKELMHRFSVSRGTVRQAIAQLAQEGLLVRRQGSGTYRAKQVNLNKAFFVDESSVQLILEIGQDCEYSMFSSTTVRATNALADALHLPHGTKVRKVTRVRTLNGKPFALGIAYARADLLQRVPGRCSQTSLLEYVRETFHLQFCERRCICSAVAASETDAKALDVAPGTPLMQFAFPASVPDVGPFILDTFRFIPGYRLLLETPDSPIK